MYQDLIFECDYFERNKYISLVKEIINRHDKEVSGLSLYVNNTPGNFEFYVYLCSTDSSIGQIIVKDFKTIGAKHRIDVSNEDLIMSIGTKRFNVSIVKDAASIDNALPKLFLFADKELMDKRGIPLTKLKSPKAIFISYCNKDSEDVDAFIKKLSAKGASVWIDKLCIDYGEDLVDKIQIALNETKSVMFWITQSFLNSNWCKNELNGVLEEDFRKNDVLKIVIKGNDVLHEELPFFLRKIKYVDRNKYQTIDAIVEELSPVLKL